MSDAPQGLPPEADDAPWRGAPIHNLPGQSQIRYRIADARAFAAEMLGRLPRTAVAAPDAPGGVAHPLKDVHVDDTPAWIPALVKSWAQVGDILTFYQERIANEGYVQTALESRS